MNQIEHQIEEEYKEIYLRQGSPGWAVHIEPAIPFVGNNYHKSQKKVLIYGSAENLTYLSGQTITDNNYRRNREVVDELGYFKTIHIAPITDGSLLTAARYILSKKGYDKSFSIHPRNFIEQVAVVNFCKFSIDPGDSGINIDYASKLRYLENSFDYVEKDLEFLKPDIIIIPRSTYKLATIKRKLSTRQREIVSIYQTNLRVINRYLNDIPINNNIYKYQFVESWLENGITGMSKYLSWLEYQINHPST